MHDPRWSALLRPRLSSREASGREAAQCRSDGIREKIYGSGVHEMSPAWTARGGQAANLRLTCANLALFFFYLDLHNDSGGAV